MRPDLPPQSAGIGHEPHWPATEFLLRALRNPSIGALMYTTRGCAERILRPHREWLGVKPRTVLEYGPGGPLTEVLYEALHDESRILAIDTDPYAIELLHEWKKRVGISDTQLLPVHDDASHARQLLHTRLGTDDADLVLSGIPFSDIPEVTGRDIIQQSYALLSPEGRMVTYQFRRSAEMLLREEFDRHDAYRQHWFPWYRIATGYKAALEKGRTAGSNGSVRGSRLATGTA